MNTLLSEERKRGWKIMLIEDLHELFPSPSVIRLVKLSGMERVQHFRHSTWEGETTWETAVADCVLDLLASRQTQSQWHNVMFYETEVWQAWLADPGGRVV